MSSKKYTKIEGLTNIYKSKFNTYRVIFSYKNYSKDKSFKCLEEAILCKKQCLDELEKIKQENEKIYNLKPITYNKEGIPYIKVKLGGQDIYYDCLVDEDKWHELSKYNWYLDNRYVKAKINKKNILLHKYIYNKYKPEINLKNKQVDHITGNDKLSKRLDNRISNLRHVTRSENCYNRISTNNKWGYRGIEKSGKKYRGYLRCKGIRYITKDYKSIDEAAIAYNVLARKHYKNVSFFNVVKCDISLIFWEDD